MKSRRDVGSWVGTGWTLHVGRISRDLASGKYYLEFNSGSYELVTSDSVSYKTSQDEGFKITRSDAYGNTWEMWDKDGMNYKFGAGGTNSRQYLNSGSLSYRWDLWADTRYSWESGDDEVQSKGVEIVSGSEYPFC